MYLPKKSLEPEEHLKEILRVEFKVEQLLA